MCSDIKRFTYVVNARKFEEKKITIVTYVFIFLIQEFMALNMHTDIDHLNFF